MEQLLAFVSVPNHAADKSQKGTRVTANERFQMLAFAQRHLAHQPFIALVAWVHASFSEYAVLYAPRR